MAPHSSISRDLRALSTSCNSHEVSSPWVGHEVVSPPLSSYDVIKIGSSSGHTRVLFVILSIHHRKVYMWTKIVPKT